MGRKFQSPLWRIPLSPALGEGRRCTGLRKSLQPPRVTAHGSAARPHDGCFRFRFIAAAAFTDLAFAAAAAAAAAAATTYPRLLALLAAIAVAYLTLELPLFIE